MKQCPTCRQSFADRRLKFCRFDGAPLMSPAVPGDEALTVLFSTGKLNERFGPLEEMRRRQGEDRSRSR
jgi:hypothetical protein